MAWFGTEEFPNRRPADDETIEDLRNDYDRDHHDLNPRTRTADEALTDIMIGNEPGLEIGYIGCEQGNPCYAKFDFWSTRLARKGVRFFLTIFPLLPNETNRTATSSGIIDPRPLYREELDTIHHVLAKFRFTQKY